MIQYSNVKKKKADFHYFQELRFFNYYYFFYINKHTLLREKQAS